MCLFNISEPKIATENIVVYKVALRYKEEYDYLRKRPMKKGQFFAPFRETPYVLGQLMKSKLRVVPMEDTDEGEDVVEDGLHSMHNYNGARYLAETINACNHYKTVHVLKAYIPKGSTYYEGTFEGKASYASDQLLIVRELTFWDYFKLWFWERGKL